MVRNTIKLVNEGVNKAVSGLSGMVGKQVAVTGFKLHKMMIKDVANLFGGHEAPIVGVYLKFTGGGDGHILVGYEPDTASKLVNVVLGKAPESIYNLSEMEKSVLGEVGNIMGSFFLNTIADDTGISLHPSPPAVMVDMAGAILDAPLAQMMKGGNEITVVNVTFSTPDKEIDGRFVIAPSNNMTPELLNIT
jgi:chemotaxis protein CheC